ncbi:uncharacterized protein LOC130434030 [Triplophysa dalaica]|uniref:uncharacterized protein LOC130434030 n=1 Tax=Triplophysa dalaica TaxID=1582913 RepID=UPI0024E03C4C|nr:uncharacterized protein LOC130434030 [Triplophysa dalaica]
MRRCVVQRHQTGKSAEPSTSQGSVPVRGDRSATHRTTSSRDGEGDHSSNTVGKVLGCVADAYQPFTVVGSNDPSRLCDPVRQAPPEIPGHSVLLSTRRECPRASERGRRPAGETCDRARPHNRDVLWVLQPVLHRPQKRRRAAPYSGSTHPEQVPAQATVPDADSEAHLGVSSTPRLVRGNRPEGRVLSRLHSSSTPTVSTVRVRGEGVSVQGPALRSGPVFAGFFETRRGRPSSPQGTGRAYTQLSRRLAYFGTLARCVEYAKGSCARAPRPFGPPGQPREEQALPSAEHLISRGGTRLCPHVGAAHYRACTVGASLPDTGQAGHNGPTETISEAPGAHGILSRGNPARVDAHATATALASESGSEDGVAPRHQADHDHAPVPLYPHPLGKVVLLTSGGSARTGFEARRSYDRRFPAGMGGSVQRARSSRAVDGPPTAMAHKLPRVAGSSSSTEEATAPSARQTRASPVGQHVCRGVHQPSGRHTLTADVATSPTPPPMESAGDQIPASHVHPGEPESDSRCALSSEDSPWRMATPSQRSPALMGAVRAGTGRPVCLPGLHPLPALVLPDRGLPRHGRLSAQLAARQEEVRLPPSEPPCTDSVQGQGRGAPSPVSCAVLAQPALVPRPHISDDSSPLADSPLEGPSFAGEGHGLAPQSGPLESPCLVPGRDEESLSGLPLAVQETVMQARAPTTRRLYAYKWRLFSSWCSSLGENPRNCPIGSVLAFLQQRLESNLSPSTLKVYVAAIAAHHDLVEGKSLGRHDLIIRFLKGARRVNPPRPRSVPSWDLNVVLQGLAMAPFEPLGDASLPHLTMKTALLTALASIKRVGDLQGLSVSPGCLEFGTGNSHVVLRPRPGYVPKVPTTPFRDQVVTLQALPSGEEDPTSHVLCPVRALRLYIDRTQNFRSSEQLFVCFGRQHQGRAVSKQRLAHWIVDAISLAYQSTGQPCPLAVRAHSTRSMASSWALAQGATLADICRAAGWATSSTFVRFYDLRVEQVSAHVLLG